MALDVELGLGFAALLHLASAFRSSALAFDLALSLRELRVRCAANRPTPRVVVSKAIPDSAPSIRACCAPVTATLLQRDVGQFTPRVSQLPRRFTGSA